MDERHQDLPVAKASLMGMGEVLMWKSNEDDAMAAFTQCKPDRTVDGDGLVSFWFKGETYWRLSGNCKSSKTRGSRSRLTTACRSSWVAMSTRRTSRPSSTGRDWSPKVPARKGMASARPWRFSSARKTGKNGNPETKYRIVRFAQLPYLPEGKHPAGFYAEFYHPQVKGQVDILIGPGGKLAYRTWQQKLGRVVAAGDLEIGKTVDTFSMGGGENVMRMTPTRFVASAEGTASSITPTEVVLPQPFDKGDRGDSKCVDLRVTWTDPQSGRTEHDTFWLKQNLPEPWESGRRRQVHETNVGSDRPIKSSFNVKQTEVGFALKLVDFDLDVDPGTKTAANYTSRVIQVDVRNDPEVVRLRKKSGRPAESARKESLA